ncbi:diacylglycerol/lipid kinase family protein [Thioclava sp. FR2]|uniref:diacylglycerol/lipid kinase family protein n=1 Tax=Thioclava sp. FR2 TaxID=3445780 RepID=UPI003EB89C96
MYQQLEPLDLKSCRLALITNGGAGKKDAHRNGLIVHDTLRPLVQDLREIPVRNGAMITQVARQAIAEGFDVVAGLGGDGTQAAIANAVTNSGAAMAVLPGGTFNYFARELGLDTMEKALAAISSGQILARDVGQVNDRIFLNNASLGLYPKILDTREDIYHRWGRSRFAAYWSVLVGLRDLYRPMRLTVRSQGLSRDYVTHLAFVARSAFQLESLGLEGAEAVRAGKFVLFIAKAQSRGGLVGGSMRLALGRVARGDDFELVVGDDVVLETGHMKRKVALDGEQGPMTMPLNLRVLPNALRIVAPAIENKPVDLAGKVA